MMMIMRGLPLKVDMDPHILQQQYLIYWNGCKHTPTYVWNAIDRLSIIWKSDLSDKIKQDFYQAVSILRYEWCIWILTKRLEKKLAGTDTRAACCLEQILEVAHHKPAAVRLSAYHLTNHPNKTNKICGTQLENRWTHKWRSFMDSYIWMPQCWLTNKDLHKSALYGHSMLPKKPANSDC